MEAIFVATCINTTACHNDKCEGTFKKIESTLKSLNTMCILIYTLLLDQMGKNLSIR